MQLLVLAFLLSVNLVANAELNREDKEQVETTLKSVRLTMSHVLAQRSLPCRDLSVCNHVSSSDLSKRICFGCILCTEKNIPCDFSHSSFQKKRIFLKRIRLGRSAER